MCPHCGRELELYDECDCYMDEEYQRKFWEAVRKEKGK